MPLAADLDLPVQDAGRTAQAGRLSLEALPAFEVMNRNVLVS
jgi:hypothetical protein